MSTITTPNTAPRHTPEELSAWLRLSLEPGLNAADTLALLTALGVSKSFSICCKVKA